MAEIFINFLAAIFKAVLGVLEGLIFGPPDPIGKGNHVSEIYSG